MKLNIRGALEAFLCGYFWNQDLANMICGTFDQNGGGPLLSVLLFFGFHWAILVWAVHSNVLYLWAVCVWLVFV